MLDEDVTQVNADPQAQLPASLANWIAAHPRHNSASHHAHDQRKRTLLRRSAVTGSAVKSVVVVSVSDCGRQGVVLVFVIA
jgi:hypothetical protein